ncbi:MAG: flagellar motor switch protein FliM [Thermodesulfobacteriota bacterium]
MQDQILDQNEVDALLQGLSDGQVESNQGAAEPPDGVVAYDFTSQEKTVRGRMPALEMVNEKFCNKVRGPLTSIIRSGVDIEGQGIDSVKYEEFVRNLTLPSSINIFTMSPFRGHGILVMDPSLAYLIIDNYFGGSGRFYTRIEGREFTPVEQSVIKKVVDVLLETLSEAWKSICDVDFVCERSEMNPHFVNVIEAVEVMMVSTFQMEIESSTNTDKNLFYFCIPYLSVESVKEKLYGMAGQSKIGADEGWIARLRQHIEHVPLRVESVVGGTRIKLSELLKLKEGDVILLDKKIYEPFDFSIEGDAKFRGRPGVSCSNYALEIQSVIDKGG